MRKFYKSMISMVMAISLVFNMTGVCFAQDKSMNENQLCSLEEIEDYIDATEGIEYTEAEEEKISTEDAVEEVFYSEEMNELDICDEEITEYNNTKYVTEIYEDGDITYVKTYSEDKQLMSIVTYDGEMINSDSYVYNFETDEYEKQHLEIVCEDNDAAGTNEVWAQAVSYNSKTKSAEWKDTTYWYQTGNNGKKTYLKIGCKASYRIRTDNLSSAKEKKCNAYKSAVKTSRSYEKKALAYAAAAGVSGATIIALVLANAAFPPSTIITIVFGVLGGSATVYNAINYTIDSFEKWQDAKDYYGIIKSYGTKL